MNKPVVAIYLSDDYFGDDVPTFLDEHHDLAYRDLIMRILSLGAEIIVARDAERNYVKDFQFRNFWRAVLSHEEVVFEKNVEDSIEFHILLDKGRFPFDIPRKINSDEMRDICRDKYLTYLFAPDFHATSFLLRNSQDLAIFRLSHRNDKIALKSLDSHGGQQVFVGELGNYTGKLPFPILAQEFIDTTGGIPSGLSEGAHDVRVCLFNGEPIYGLLREPPADQFVSNLAFGGTIRALYLDEIPLELIEKAKILDTRFGYDGPRFFSADWGFNGKEWKLFELNHSTGLVHKSVVGPAADWYSQNLARKLVESAKLENIN